MAKNKVSATLLWRFLFLVYCGIMLWLLLYRSHSWNLEVPYKQLLQQNSNFVPLRTTKDYLYVLLHSADTYMRTHCFVNLAGNVLLFVPAGWLLPTLWQRLHNFLRFFTVSCGILLLIETVQLFSLLGRFDIDDLILNLMGMAAGFLLFAIFCKK